MMHNQRSSLWIPVAGILLLAGNGRLMAQGGTTWTHLDPEVELDGEWSNPTNWSDGVPNSGLGISSALLTNTAAAYIVNVDNPPAAFGSLTLANLASTPSTLNIRTNMDFGVDAPIGLRVNNGRIDIQTGGALRFSQMDTFATLCVDVRNGAAAYWALSANRVVSGGEVVVHEGGTLTTGVSGNNFLTFQGGSQVRVEGGGTWEHTTRNLTIGADSVSGASVLTNRGSILLPNVWCRFAIGSNSEATYVHELVMESGLILKTGTPAQLGRGLDIGTRSNHLATKGRFTVMDGVVTNLHELMIGKSADTGTSGAKIGRSYTTEGELRIYGGTWMQGAERVQVGGWAVAPENGIDSASYGTLKGVLSQTGGLFQASGDILVGNGPARGFIDISGGRFVNSNATGSARMILGLQGQPTLPASVGPGVGALAIDGGLVTLDHLVSTSVVATVGSSAVTLHGGTLEILRSATIGGGTTFAVGDGTNPAHLVLGDGFTGAFDEDLVIATHAVLALGHANATASATVAGNLVLAEDARLDWKFNTATQDLATVTGVVTLPVSARVELNGLDASTPAIIPLISATGGISGDPSGWPGTMVGGLEYRAVVQGNTLHMQVLPPGTVLLLH